MSEVMFWDVFALTIIPMVELAFAVWCVRNRKRFAPRGGEA